MIFVRGCVLEANKNDSHNDILTKEDIKKINRNLGDIQFDTQHNREQFTGCRVIENTVYDNPVTIDNTPLNSGSWVITLEVDNPSVEERISNGELQGFSLFSYAGGETSYNDVMDKSDIYPIFLSFVQNPANRIPFEVLSEDEYIQKSRENIMADDKKILDKIRELLTSTEQETTKEEPVQDKEEGAVSKAEETKEAEAGEKVETQEKQEEVETDEPVKEDKAVTKAECKEEEKEEAAVSKAETEEVSNAEIKELLVQVIELLKNPPKNEDAQKDGEIKKEEAEPSNEEEVETKKYIVKQSQKNMNINTPKPVPKPNFDLFGRKL